MRTPNHEPRYMYDPDDEHAKRERRANHLKNASALSVLVIALLAIRSIVSKNQKQVSPSPTPSPRPTETILLPTPTPQELPKAPFTKPDPEEGWYDAIYADALWIRQVSPVGEDEIPCQYFSFHGGNCGGKTVEILWGLDPEIGLYYLNLYPGTPEGIPDHANPTATYPLITGQAFTLKVPEGGFLAVGNLPATDISQYPTTNPN